MTLTCPGDPNYAAVAKQLHSTALQAEADIAAIEQRMRLAVNPPTVIRTMSGNLTGLSANVDNDFGVLGNFVTVFDNNFGGFAFGPQQFSFFTQTLGEGLYEVGTCLTAVPSGVSDNDSVRYFVINHMRPDPNAPNGERFLQRVAITMFETNTGIGTEVSIVGEFRAQPLDRFAFIFIHGNTSSTMDILSGAIIWATKLSDSTLNTVL